MKNLEKLDKVVVTNISKEMNAFCSNFGFEVWFKIST